MGDKAQAGVFRPARPEGRGPRAARGAQAHTRARDRERRIPREADGPHSRREPIGLLLMALERLPGRRLGSRARRGDARVAGIRQALRIQVRARDAAAGILPLDALPSPEIDARAGHTRLHAQRKQAHHSPRPQGQAPPRSGAPRLHEPRSHLQARGRHHLLAHRRGMAVPGHGDRPVHAHGGGDGRSRTG